MLTELAEAKRRLAENESTVARLIELLEKTAGLEARFRVYSVYEVRGAECFIDYTERVTEGPARELRLGRVSLNMARMDAASVAVVEKGGGFFVVSSGRGVSFEGAVRESTGAFGEVDSAGVDVPFESAATAETTAAALRRTIEVCSAAYRQR